MIHPSLLLVGSGPMAIDYARVLMGLQVAFDVVGRSQAGCDDFTAQTGVRARSGGIETAGEVDGHLYRSAIIAVDIDQLSGVLKELIRRKIVNILVEKPAGRNAAEISLMAREARESNIRVVVAYNRRFYSSVQMARSLIQSDGGLTSMFFEFTERSHEIESLALPREVKEEWLLANSSHVCDLAFFLAGRPVKMDSQVAGKLDWHPAGAQFVGCGVTDRGVLFSYHSNWRSAGRWGIELCTEQRRLFLRPLELLSEQLRGRSEINPLTLDDARDKQYKPGLYAQTKAFLEQADQSECLLSLEEHEKNVRDIYCRMIHTGSSLRG